MKPFALIVSLFFLPSDALAIVPHDYPGIYIHQMGHIYFVLSSAFILWAIMHHRLHKERGWRYIVLAQIFFILWNVDTFIGHITEFWIEPNQIIGSTDGWNYFRRMIIIEGRDYIYYITKHDHIWIVPGMLFFYMGLKEHLKEESISVSSYAVLPLLPIILVDITGSFLMIVLSMLSLFTALRLYRINRGNILWNYMLWLSLAYIIFSFSRSLGHILKRFLIPAGYGDVWKLIEPYSGSLNTFTFIVIGSVSLFFFRAYDTYLKMLADKKRIEEINADLAELNQELETLVAERTMSLMALTVADQIRNPAALIGCVSRRILKKREISKEIEEDLRDIINESNKLETIVKNFESLLKSKQSMYRYEDINEIVKGVISIVGKEADEKNIRLSLNLEGNHLKINMQKNLLRAAIFHIIRNSIEATPEGGRITIKTYGNGDSVVLIISDTGPGIPPEDIGRIFDPFFSTKLFRFGMGLPLVKQIVSEHLGEIKVESEPGKGTTFKLIFPVRWIEKR